MKIKKAKKGYVLIIVLVAIIIVIMLAYGEMNAAYLGQIQAINAKSQAASLLAAEAGYEKTIFWMSQQPDLLGALQAGGGSGTLDFGSSQCSYKVSFLKYMGQKPLFRIHSIGTSGRPIFRRDVDVAVIQEVTGWAMDQCRIINSATTTTNVYFGNTEVIEIPIHINSQNESPDQIDINILGSPQFKRKVSMGESRKTAGGTDKYASVINCFQAGIDFDQPYMRITDSTAISSKLARFRDSTKTAYKITPGSASTAVSSPRISAVQLEFFISGGLGKVRITNNCTVKLIGPSPGSFDYMINPTGNPTPYKLYDIYGYHYSKTTEPPATINVTDTYVSQTFGSYSSDPGGQIYVNGNVIIGGNNATSADQVVKGKITVVATGNIWIADSIKVDGPHDADGKPTADNPNVIGLIAQGVIKVVDTGLSPPSAPTVAGLTYQPIGNTRVPSPTYPGRWLPNPTVIEAAMTLGGGGFGAENSIDRRTYTGVADELMVTGSIAEPIRGRVGGVNASGEPVQGYYKTYRMDNRLCEGILPGDIWFSGKYIPAPAGWTDYRTPQQN